MKKCSLLLIMMEIQIVTTRRYNLTVVKMTIIKKTKNKKGESLEKGEHSGTAGSNVN